MAKAKYATDTNGNKIYMISHTKAVYDSNGQVLEDRLQNMATASNDYTDTKVAELINGAPETMDTLAELADAIENNETVVEALNSAIGTKANKTDVDIALGGKLDVDGDASNTTVGFTSASTRTNIATGETQSTLFGKIKKWFSDLKTVAFTGKYSDLTDTPTNATASTSGLMSSADKSKLDGIATGAQVNSVTGVKGAGETAYRTGNINITKSNIGLGNVDNISDANKPISTAVQNALNGKLDGSWSDANGYANIGELTLEVSDLAYTVYTAYLGNNNEFIGIFEVANQVSDNRDAIDTKQATITGGASTITNSNLTASRALVSDSNGKVAVSAVTSTELGYIDGVTSNVQTQLNAKAPKSHASTATTYGIGTSSNYGHVKLSDSTSSTSGTGSGVAATPAAVKAAYDKAVSVQEDVVGMNDAFNSNGYAGAEEVVNDVSQIISEKIAPPTTITIANNTSKHKSYADYICTGTSDQTVINNAIAALPDGGGKIVLLEGTYNISGSITVNKPNVTIEGMGNGTVLKRMFNDGSQWNSGVINITGNSCIVKELSIDGNNSAYTSSNNKGILLIDECSDNVLDNVKVYNEKYGIIAGGGATHNYIQANISNVHTGILLYYVNYNTVRNCIISGVSNNGIECNWYSNGHIIEQNHISNMTNAGIYVNSNCTREIISDNVVVKNNDTLYTIYIAGTYNIVVDNQLPNMNYTNTSSGTTNSFDNNKT